MIRGTGWEPTGIPWIPSAPHCIFRSFPTRTLTRALLGACIHSNYYYFIINSGKFNEGCQEDSLQAGQGRVQLCSSSPREDQSLCSKTAMTSLGVTITGRCVTVHCCLEQVCLQLPGRCHATDQQGQRGILFDVRQDVVRKHHWVCVP